MSIRSCVMQSICCLWRNGCESAKSSYHERACLSGLCQDQRLRESPRIRHDTSHHRLLFQSFVTQEIVAVFLDGDYAGSIGVHNGLAGQPVRTLGISLLPVAVYYGAKMPYLRGTSSFCSWYQERT